VATFSAGPPGLLAAACLTKTLLETTDKKCFFCTWDPIECFESFGRWEKSDTYSALRAAEATTAVAQLACPPAMSSVEHLKRLGESALREPGCKSVTAAGFSSQSHFFKM
jgi:hypothetical protein